MAQRILAALVIVLVSSLSLCACTLALDSPKALTPDCKFDGSDGVCGTCIRQHCSTQLGSCCGDANCQATLDALDRCAGKSDQTACSTLRTNTTLGSCVNASCKDQCLGEGKGMCFSSDGSCNCNDIAPSDAATCSESSIGGGSCCADFGWPGSGLACDCLAFRCKETADGCACSSSGGPNTSCSGVHCCISGGDCRCGTKACESYETPVDACTSALVSCNGRSRVTSCSESVH